MSENCVPTSDVAWENFISTGSVYDYLEYKSKTSSNKNDDKEIILTNNIGDFCENRSERISNKRGRSE